MCLIRKALDCIYCEGIAPPSERSVSILLQLIPNYIFYIYIYYHNLEFVEGQPDLDMFDGVKRTLLIIDDLMHKNDEIVSK